MLTLTFIKWAQEIPKQIMVHYYVEERNLKDK